MKKISLFIMAACMCAAAFSQVPEDAARLSWFPHNGTARYMSIGGVMGSLGGDITATFVNPAGLGFYRTREFVFTPEFQLNRSKTTYLDSVNKYKDNRVGFGTTGVVIGWNNKYNINKSNAVSVAINQTADFKQSIRYSGYNNYSSFSEQFAEEFARSGYDINSVLQSLSPLPYTSAPALYTYLIDTVRINGGLQVKAAPEYLLDGGGTLRQDYIKNSAGGMYELAVGLAENRNEKWLYGLSIGIPLVYYNSHSSFTETDTSSNTHNNFKSFSYTDAFTSKGGGANLKLGAIYRPKEYIRIGLAVHTPSLIYLTDTHTSSLETNLENSQGALESFNVNSNAFTNDQPGESQYIQATPWKAMLSGSYVFREVQNTKRQKGFISADIEYAGHQSSRFFSSKDNLEEPDKAYYKALGKAVKEYYKGSFNFRAGGELKFNTIMGRLGFAYYSSPYRDKSIKASQMLLSGGLGYRNKGFFIDLTYAHNIKKDEDFAYRLQDRANTYAVLKRNNGNISATVGFKF
ncbi:MAG: hypothetical protein ABIT96_02140 [Ferruginibacter sp.]